MLALRDPNRLNVVNDPAIRSLLTQRFAQLAEDQPYDPDEIGYFVLVQAGDTLAIIEQETGCWLESGLLNDARFGEPNYVPAFEFLEEHPTCYEAVFIFNDAGYGIALVIPKVGVEPDVLAYCQCYATPAHQP